MPNLPARPPDNYLRDAMVATLARQDVEFDVCVQVQTDPFLMPIENAAVNWPVRLSPRVPVAVRADSASNVRFAGADRVRPRAHVQPVAHLPEHRPLGK